MHFIQRSCICTYNNVDGDVIKNIFTKTILLEYDSPIWKKCSEHVLIRRTILALVTM
jgi:hypothetical protein